MSTDISEGDYYLNDEFPPSDDSALTVRERQLRFRNEIERARCSAMTDDERQRVVRYIKEFVNLIYYPDEIDESGWDVGDALDAEIAERSDRYYGQLFPRVFSPEIGEYE
jgi:hypothetical protein